MARIRTPLSFFVLIGRFSNSLSILKSSSERTIGRSYALAEKADGFLERRVGLEAVEGDVLRELGAELPGADVAGFFLGDPLAVDGKERRRLHSPKKDDKESPGTRSGEHGEPLIERCAAHIRW